MGNYAPARGTLLPRLPGPGRGGTGGAALTPGIATPTGAPAASLTPRAPTLADAGAATTLIAPRPKTISGISTSTRGLGDAATTVRRSLIGGSV